MKEKPLIGTAAIIVRNGRVLLGKRKNSHGHGDWGFPGGHLEFGEAPEDCIRREVREETGLAVRSITAAPYTNDYFPEKNKHYVTLFFIVTCKPGEPIIRESEKLERWEWYPWDKLPDNLFLPIRNLLKRGFNPVRINT
ncbi:MAG: NUDIX hydrolase [Patescibacteria group bacterium]